MDVQKAAAGALYNLACIGACRGGCAGACGYVAPLARGAADAISVAIVAARGIKPLVALLLSPSAEVQKAATDALQNLASNGVCMFTRSEAAARELAAGAGWLLARAVAQTETASRSLLRVALSR